MEAAYCVESCRSGVGRGKWRLGTGSCWKVDGSDGVWLEVKGEWSGEEGTQAEAGRGAVEEGGQWQRSRDARVGDNNGCGRRCGMEMD